MSDALKPKKGDLIALEAIGNRGIIITTNLRELRVSAYEKIWKMEKGEVISINESSPLIAYVVELYVLELYHGMLVYKILHNNKIYYVADCDAVITLL